MNAAGYQSCIASPVLPPTRSVVVPTENGPVGRGNWKVGKIQLIAVSNSNKPASTKRTPQPHRQRQAERRALRARTNSPSDSGDDVGAISAATASSAIVGCRSRCRADNLIPSCIIRAAMRNIWIEFAPSANRLSLTPTRSIPRTLPQISASFISIGVRGGSGTIDLYCDTDAGDGSALRSILPLGVIGIASSRIQSAGTI